MSNITKRAMAQSLKKMLQIKDLDKITITDITNDCGINRQTFYYHFKDIYDLLEWIFENEVVEKIEKETTIETWQENFRYVLNYMLKNKKFIIKTYNSLSRKILLDFLFNQYNSIFIEIVENLSQNYNITNPQEIYEGNYNNLKLELEKNTIKKVEPIIDKISEVKEIEKIPKVKIEKVEKAPEVKVNIIKAKDIINNDTLNINLDTVEDKTLKIKKENMEKNLISNTISLNDLIKQDDEIKETSKVIDTINDESYSLNDYKKIVEMLKEIKNNSNKNNISIDDAVTMSLINNYSIDDCVKFKEILESNLN